jgi:hypothetical protein
MTSRNLGAKLVMEMNTPYSQLIKPGGARAYKTSDADVALLLLEEAHLQ